MHCPEGRSSNARSRGFKNREGAKIAKLLNHRILCDLGVLAVKNLARKPPGGAEVAPPGRGYGIKLN
jgi:hypothetical protein